MDEGVAQRSGHVGVHFGNDDFCRLGRSLRHTHFDTERAEPVLVGRTDMDQGNIEGKASILEENGNLRQETWCEVCAPLIDSQPDIVADKEGVDAEVSGHLRRDVVGISHGQDLHDLDVRELRGPLHKGGHDLLGYRAVAGQEDTAP